MAYGWEGEKIRLVPIDVEKHLDNAVQWFNDPEVTQWLLMGDMPLTKLAERDYLEARSRDMSQDIGMAVETLDGECRTMGGAQPRCLGSTERSDTAEAKAQPTLATAEPESSRNAHSSTSPGGVHIGFSGIHKISWRDGTAVTGTVLGDKTCWGKGFGTDVVRTRTRYAFEVLGLRLLFSGCIDGNTASYKMLFKNGYREYGRAPKKFWKRGAYRDEIMMCVAREDWEPG